MLPKWKPFSGARHLMLNRNFERRWSDIKFQRPPSSQKILGGAGLKCQVLVYWRKSHATFLHRRSIKLAFADFALYSKTFFALIFFLILCHVYHKHSWQKNWTICFVFFAVTLTCPLLFVGFRHMRCRWKKTWKTLWAGWSRCWPRCCIFDQSSLYFGGKENASRPPVTRRQDFWIWWLEDFCHCFALTLARPLLHWV